MSGSPEDRVIFSEARARLQHALLCKDNFLRQQSSVRWVREGDVNTRFFHAMIQNKHQLFHFHQIQDASSVWLSKSSAIADSAVTFFQGLLTDEDSQFQPEDFSFIPSLITEEDDVDLCMIPDIEEVRQVVFSIDPDSAPGLNGFCSRFYQLCLDIVGADLHTTILDYFSGFAMPRGFKSILLILLPKKDSPATWADF